MELTAGHVWLMVAAALVLFMTPGLAFFYGGMTRAKAALNMMMMSFISIGMVGVVWVLWGASMSSGEATAPRATPPSMPASTCTTCSPPLTRSS